MMGPVLVKDSCPLGFQERSTVAHVHLQLVPFEAELLVLPPAPGPVNKQGRLSQGSTAATSLSNVGL